MSSPDRRSNQRHDSRSSSQANSRSGPEERSSPHLDDHPRRHHPYDLNRSLSSGRTYDWRADNHGHQSTRHHREHQSRPTLRMYDSYRPNYECRVSKQSETTTRSGLPIRSLQQFISSPPPSNQSRPNSTHANSSRPISPSNITVGHRRSSSYFTPPPSRTAPYLDFQTFPPPPTRFDYQTYRPTSSSSVHTLRSSIQSPQPCRGSPTQDTVELQRRIERTNRDGRLDRYVPEYAVVKGIAPPPLASPQPVYPQYVVPYGYPGCGWVYAPQAVPIQGMDGKHDPDLLINKHGRVVMDSYRPEYTLNSLRGSESCGESSSAGGGSGERDANTETKLREDVGDSQGRAHLQAGNESRAKQGHTKDVADDAEPAESNNPEGTSPRQSQGPTTSTITRTGSDRELTGQSSNGSKRRSSLQPQPSPTHEQYQPQIVSEQAPAPEQLPKLRSGKQRANDAQPSSRMQVQPSRQSPRSNNSKGYADDNIAFQPSPLRIRPPLRNVVPMPQPMPNVIANPSTSFSLGRVKGPHRRSPPSVVVASLSGNLDVPERRAMELPLRSTTSDDEDDHVPLARWRDIVVNINAVMEQVTTQPTSLGDEHPRGRGAEAVSDDDAPSSSGGESTTDTLVEPVGAVEFGGKVRYGDVKVGNAGEKLGAPDVFPCFKVEKPEIDPPKIVGAGGDVGNVVLLHGVVGASSGGDIVLEDAENGEDQRNSSPDQVNVAQVETVGLSGEAGNDKEAYASNETDAMQRCNQKKPVSLGHLWSTYMDESSASSDDTDASSSSSGSLTVRRRSTHHGSSSSYHHPAGYTSATKSSRRPGRVTPNLPEDSKGFDTDPLDLPPQHKQFTDYAHVQPSGSSTGGASATDADNNHPPADNDVHNSHRPITNSPGLSHPHLVGRRSPHSLTWHPSVQDNQHRSRPLRRSPSYVVQRSPIRSPNYTSQSSQAKFSGHAARTPSTRFANHSDRSSPARFVGETTQNQPAKPPTRAVQTNWRISSSSVGPRSVNRRTSSSGSRGSRNSRGSSTSSPTPTEEQEQDRPNRFSFSHIPPFFSCRRRSSNSPAEIQPPSSADQDQSQDQTPEKRRKVGSQSEEDRMAVGESQREADNRRRSSMFGGKWLSINHSGSPTRTSMPPRRMTPRGTRQVTVEKLEWGDRHVMTFHYNSEEDREE